MSESKSKYAVNYKGETKFFINKQLCKNQKLSDERIRQIIGWHIMNLINKEVLKEAVEKNNRVAIKTMLHDIESVEYHLQEYWGFKRDKSYHKFWLLPYCTCPKLDNEDAYPTGHYIINENCILHGQHE